MKPQLYIYIYKQKKILYELSLFLSVQSTRILRFWNQLTNTHHSHTDKEGQNIPPSWFIAFTISLGEEFQKREELVFTESLNLKTQTFGILGKIVVFLCNIYSSSRNRRQWRYLENFWSPDHAGKSWGQRCRENTRQNKRFECWGDSNSLQMKALNSRSHLEINRKLQWNVNGTLLNFLIRKNTCC